jgi:hypothetical protein
MSTLRYTKRGAGQRNGSEWFDAKALTSLSEDLLQAKSGDVFLVGFDRDREDPVFWAQSMLSLRNSGSASRPIRLRVGYIGHKDDVQPIGAQPASICFQSTKTSLYKKAAPDFSGDPYLRLSSVEHIDISGFVIRGGPNNGFIRFEPSDRSDGSISEIELRDIHASQVGRVIETQRGTLLSGVTIEHCSAFGVARGFARFRSIANAFLRDLVLDAGGLDGAGENVCQLIAFEGGTNVRCERIIMNDAVNMIGAGEGRRSAYIQGDGIVCERETSDFVFRNCHVAGMGDGGFDLKTRNFVIEDCSATRCKFGVRAWSEGNNIIRRSSIHSPRSAGTGQAACLWVGGHVDLVDCDLQAGPGTAIFRTAELERPPRIRMFGGGISTERDASLLVGSAGGAVELNDVAVNGEVRSGLVRR